MISRSGRGFTAKIWAALAASALVVLAYTLGEILLALFGAVVISVLLNAAVRRIRALTSLSVPACLALVIGCLLMLAGGIGWFFGEQLYDQWGAMRALLPQAYADWVSWLEGSELGQLLNQILMAMEPDVAETRAQLSALLSSATSMAVQIGLVLVGALYLSADPSTYRRIVIALTPPRFRWLTAETLYDASEALRAWLVGQLVSMGAVGLMTGVGLWMLDVPAALALAVLTAALGIVPLVGPVLAVVPATLLGFSVSPETALGVVILYIVVQQIEGHVLQPLIQKRAVDLPPVVLLFSLVAVGIVLGPIGVIFAAPLTVVVYVAVKRIYIEHVLASQSAALANARCRFPTDSPASRPREF